MKYYSQFNQDQFVYNKYFQNKNNGYFVDIGAHDGVTFSNSKFFEDLGWDGVCIEPNPIVFSLLESNRNCKCVEKAISDSKKISQFFQIIDGPDMLSGLVDEFTDTGIHRINQELKDAVDGFDYINVECDLFENIVSQNHIDFLSLDTEGNEMKILQSIDFEKFNIDVITLENNEYDNKFQLYLKDKGYDFICRLGCDELYKKQ